MDELINGIKKLEEDVVTTDYDMLAAKNILAFTNRIFSTIYGIIIYGLIFGFTLVTAIDVCYLTLPAFRSFVNDGSDKGVRQRMASYDAHSAVEESSLSSGKSALRIYLGKRIKSYILVAVMISVLLLGGYSAIEKLLTKIVDTIVMLFMTL